MKNVGELIREKRKQLEMKVYELAKKVGVDPVYITQIEKHNKLPSLEVFNRICKIIDLDCKSQYLAQKYPELGPETTGLRQYLDKVENDLRGINKNEPLFDFCVTNPLGKKIYDFVTVPSNKMTIEEFIAKIITEDCPNYVGNKKVVKFVEKQLKIAVNSWNQHIASHNKLNESIEQICTIIGPPPSPPAKNSKNN